MASSELDSLPSRFAADWAIVLRLLDLERRGCTFKLEAGGRFRVTPPDRLTADDVAFLRAQRDEARACIEWLPRLCDHQAITARRAVFELALAHRGDLVLPLLVFRPGVPYVAGLCYSCGEPTGRPTHGRCWRCALAARLACRLPLPADFFAAYDVARVLA